MRRTPDSRNWIQDSNSADFGLQKLCFPGFPVSRPGIRIPKSRIRIPQANIFCILDSTSKCFWILESGLFYIERVNGAYILASSYEILVLVSA